MTKTTTAAELRKAKSLAAKYKKVLSQIARMDPTWDARAPVSVARKALGLPEATGE